MGALLDRTQGQSPIFNFFLDGQDAVNFALALADYIGEPRPEWEVAVGRLGHAIVAHPGSFVPKDRHAMEWYYPVLCGALRGPAARACIALLSDWFPATTGEIVHVDGGFHAMGL